MTSFVHPSFPQEHVGADRAAHLAESVSSLFDGVRAPAAMLLAAAVSTIVVVANQVIDTWSDDHLFSAWVVLWLVAFSATALLAAPLHRLASRSRGALRSFKAAHREAAQDRKMWELALADARVMADISRAMKAGAPTKVAYY